MIYKLPLQLFRILLGFRNKSTYFDQIKNSVHFAILDMHSICNVTSRVKSETCKPLVIIAEYESLFSILNYLEQQPHNSLRNFSPPWRSFNKFTLLVASSKTQLVRAIIIYNTKMADCIHTVFGQNISKNKQGTKKLQSRVFIYYNRFFQIRQS